MEVEEKAKEQRNTHYGHTIKRLRRDLGLSQKELGDRVGMVQQNVSIYEEQKRIDDELLQRFANALAVPVKLIQMMEDDKPLAYYVENNTITDNTVENVQTSTIASNIVNENVTNNYNTDKDMYTLLLKIQERVKWLEEEVYQLKNK